MVKGIAQNSCFGQYHQLLSKHLALLAPPSAPAFLYCNGQCKNKFSTETTIMAPVSTEMTVASVFSNEKTQPKNGGSKNGVSSQPDGFCKIKPGAGPEFYPHKGVRFLGLVTKVTTKVDKVSQRGMFKTFTNYFVKSVKLAELYRPQSNNNARLYLANLEG